MEVNCQDLEETVFALSFSDFPEDVQLCILSFLDPSELASFACTSKKFVSLCRDDQRLWFSICDRRWGSCTLLKRWGHGKISYKVLYRILSEYENLIGFWRRCGVTNTASVNSPPAPLVYFEWGPFYITGSIISPSKNGSYEVIRSPFLWVSITSKGVPINYLDPEGRFDFTDDLLMDSEKLGFLENELIQVNVSFISKCLVVVEENLGSIGFGKVPNSGIVRIEEYQNVCGSPPDRWMSEIYQYLANRTSPGGNGVSRRQRRREKEKQERLRKWEPEHFVKIVNCSPTLTRPLQGLWKILLIKDGEIQRFLVRWIGRLDSDCIWIPKYTFQLDPDLLEHYWSQHDLLLPGSPPLRVIRHQKKFVQPLSLCLGV